MHIAGFVKTALREWEGENACAILLSGCNFRCPYCNRPDLMFPSGESIGAEPILDYIKENRDFLEAVVISGGEPTVNGDLYKLIGRIKGLKVKVKLDTNGSNPDMLDDLAGAKLVDRVCMNVMAPLDPETYSKAAGVCVDTETIKRSLKVLRDSGIPYDIRTVAVPGIITHDSFVRMLRDLDGSENMIIQQFDNRAVTGPYAGTKPYPEATLAEMAGTAKGCFRKVKIRGI
ncbi:MAG: anaerobic ribonucleoside-triphosphate reductase activating protein [Candidatus Methanoplasma sp.]|nr:anaerobic ribonucleoside-triphosphate reductase activating protein [Candidatus Methanoplasma sp.]